MAETNISNSLFIGLIIALILIIIYITIAYFNRLSKRRLEYLIRERFLALGDGNQQFEPGTIVIDDVIIKRYHGTSSVETDVIYHLKGTTDNNPHKKTKHMLYRLEKDCLHTDPHCVKI